MTDELEDEVSETQAFTLIEEMHAADPFLMPQSPRKTYAFAQSMGWDTRAWASFGEYAPTLYVAGSKEGDENQHLPGEVKADGYIGKTYIIEARDPDIHTLGFRAYYKGRVYEDARKAPLGSFDFAMIADPIGIPTLMHATYKLLRPSRGKFETDKSYTARVKAVDDLVSGADAKYNTGEFYWPTSKVMDVAKDFDGWLGEWKSYQ